MTESDHDEAMAEFDQNFPGQSKADTCIVCDDCYRKFMGN